MAFCIFRMLNTVCDTMELIQKLEIKNESVLNIFKTRSMRPISPVLMGFPMVCVHYSVDVYRTFRSDPMNLFSLAMSRLLKECTSIMLGDESMCTSAMMTGTGSSRTFKQVGESGLHQLNIFLTDLEQNSVGIDLLVGDSKGKCGDRLRGFFTNTENIGMIEAKDNKAVDMVSSVFESMTDLCSGLCIPLLHWATRNTLKFSISCSGFLRA